MNRHQAWLTCVVLSWTASASAQPVVPPTAGGTQTVPDFAQAVPAGAAPEAPHVHVHDGFYLRLGGGFGAYNETIGHGTGQDAPRNTVSGMGTTGELALGGTIGRGFVLGGGSWSTTVQASDVTSRNGGVSPRALGGTPSLTLIGPFFDYYFDPTRGVHFQLAVALATSREVNVDTGKVDRDQASIGGGVMLGFGHEWWIGEQWSAGLLGRAVVAATGSKTDGQRYWHVFTTVPSVLFTVTYH